MNKVIESRKNYLCPEILPMALQQDAFICASQGSTGDEWEEVNLRNIITATEP